MKIKTLTMLGAAWLCLASTSAARSQDSNDWVARSNQNAQLVLEVMASLSPESAGSLGVDGLDEEIFDLKAGIFERSMAKSAALLQELHKRLDKETEPRVRQDLGILIQAVEETMTSSRLEHELLLPYRNMTRTIFFGVRSLIDPQVDKARYPAVVARLRKYAGVEEGYQPVTELAKARTMERLNVEGLVGPFKGEVEQDLERAETFITGMESLLAESGVAGWEEPYHTLAGQLRDYNQWIRQEILPRARDDFRSPPALYEDALRQFGVDVTAQELIQTATQGFADIRNEMVALAPQVAEKYGYKTSDYREVIRLLKQDRIPGDQMLDYYFARLAELESIIREQKLLTLPERDAGIRMATAAETAAQPAPHLDIPRLIGNTGEYPEFILPLLEKNEDGSWPETDENFKAGTLTLTAHEARPGHELQFSAMIETGVSIARAVFSFNSVNVEGWALYAEAIVKPYLPLEAQMFSLQYRMMRAARMFLDPMLNLGMITPAEAKRVLTDDVVVSDAWAQNEVERYTYRMPGQATAYYFGYSRLQSLRIQTELALPGKFNQQAFHDFILAQGMLPPAILRDAVMTDFVPAQKGK